MNFDWIKRPQTPPVFNDIPNTGSPRELKLSCGTIATQGPYHVMVIPEPRYPTPEETLIGLRLGKSQMRINAEKDPNYCPFCMRCPGLIRMVKVAEFQWRCKCGATHDERNG